MEETLVETFFQWNIIFLFAGLLGLSISRIFEAFNYNLSAIIQIKIQYTLLIFSFACCLAVNFIPATGLDSIHSVGFGEMSPSLFPQNLDAPVTYTKQEWVPVNGVSSLHWRRILSIIFGVGLILSLLNFFIGLLRSFKIACSGLLLRKIGKVEIRILDNIQSPMALSFSKTFILIPSSLIHRHDIFKICMKHEIIHIRQQDTMTTLGLSFLRSCLFINPIFWIWINRIFLIQEMRVDEILTTQHKINIKKYATCLYEVATQPRPLLFRFVGATGMGRKASQNQLSRRMVSMKNQYRKISKLVAVGGALFAALFLTGITLTAHGLSSSPKLDSKKIKEMIKNNQFSDGVEVEINHKVLEQLYRFTKTKKGKAFSKTALKNYAKNKDLLDDLIEIMKMPRELLGVAFVESGFRNLPEHINPNRSAGMWQFIPSTARSYNLAVDEKYDDRMDVTMETISAMKYLKKLHRQFTDWRLAIMAYNMGERNLEIGIKKVGTRDPWILQDQGIRGDLNYLSKVQAAMIIMAFPELLN